MMMQASDPGPTDTHDWNDLRCFPSHGESDCVQAEGVTNDHLAIGASFVLSKSVSADIGKARTSRQELAMAGLIAWKNTQP
jgi:hypothetical protein